MPCTCLTICLQSESALAMLLEAVHPSKELPKVHGSGSPVIHPNVLSLWYTVC